jgi:hypothetical protein
VESSDPLAASQEEKLQQQITASTSPSAKTAQAQTQQEQLKILAYISKKKGAITESLIFNHK